MHWLWTQTHTNMYIHTTQQLATTHVHAHSHAQCLYNTINREIFDGNKFSRLAEHMVIYLLDLLAIFQGKIM